MRSSLYGFCNSSWERCFRRASIRALTFDFVLTKFRVQCYATRRTGRVSRKPKLGTAPTTMENEKDAFYVVRKGNVLGVYKSLNDCQCEVGSSVCDPPISIYKGYHLPKDAEEYLVSHGLKNSIYSIDAADVKEDLFGTLVPCPFQQPTSSKVFDKNSAPKRSLEVLRLDNNEKEIGSTRISIDPPKKHTKLEHHVKPKALTSNCLSCILEFDGASKGNPGKAGAGAVLRAEDGSLICRLREGVGIATNNVAEYRGMILGMKYAIQKGFKRISIRGDSRLVCMQIQGLWKTKNQNMAELCAVAKELKDKFLSFEIAHVLRDFNSEADAQANLATNLKDGEIQEES